MTVGWGEMLAHISPEVCRVALVAAAERGDNQALQARQIAANIANGPSC